MISRRTKSLLFLAGILTAVIAMSACSPSPAPVADMKKAKIILTPDPDDKSLLWWEVQGFDWHHYHSILLEPVVLDLSEENMADLTPEELDDFRRQIRITLTEKLAPEFSLSAKEGSGVLVLRVTVKEIVTASPLLNLATTLALFVPLDMGGASIQAEFFDSLTGECVAAMADRKTGTPLQLASGFTRLGHARTALNQWAEELKLALAENP